MNIEKIPIKGLPSTFEAFKRVICTGLFSNKAARKTFIFIFISLFFSCIAEWKADSLFSMLLKGKGEYWPVFIKYISFYTCHLLFGWLHNFFFYCNTGFFKSVISSFLLKYYLESNQFDIEHLGLGKVHAIINRQSDSAILMLNHLCLGTFYSSFYLVLFMSNLVSLLVRKRSSEEFILASSLSFLFVIFTGIILYCCRRSFRLKRRLVIAEHKSSSLLFDILKNFPVIKSFYKETEEVKKYQSFQQKLIIMGFEFYSYDCFVSLIFKAIFFVSIIGSALYTKVVKKCWGGSFFVTYFDTLRNFKKHINGLKDAIFRINDKLVDTVTCDAESPIPDTKKVQLISEVDRIMFDSVSISLSGKLIFSDLNLKFPSGTKIAVTGRNGVGKSTVIKSLMGLNEYTGSIKINDCEVREVNEANLRHHFSYVPQEPHLFNMTILENLRYGNACISDQEIIEKCKECGVHEMIKGLENGYQTVIGENACNLSGGQAQMINFVRAYIKDAPIFLLDEPTSNLDYSTSLRMMNMITGLLKDKTVFMTTHNPDHLKCFDKIINISEKKAEVFNSFAEFTEDGTFANRI